MLEQPNTEKTMEELQELVVARACTHARDLISARFEHAENSEDNLAFHNVEHTDGVVRRTELILRTIRNSVPDAVSVKDIALGKVAAAFHDVVQEWDEDRTEDSVKRRRRTGSNEITSATEAVVFLEKMNKEFGQDIFSKDDLGIITDAIGATVPDYNAEEKTVVQPNITERSSIVARALALADLGTAGMDGADAFVREGNTLFREENLDIARAMKQSQSITSQEKDRYRKRMLEWSVSQEIFARGRRNLFDKELQKIPFEAVISVKLLFGKFKESITAVGQLAKNREALSFEEIARDMGYVL